MWGREVREGMKKLKLVQIKFYLLIGKTTTHTQFVFEVRKLELSWASTLTSEKWNNRCPNYMEVRIKWDSNNMLYR